MVSEREDCGHRRFPLLSRSRPSLSSHSPSRPGPLPRRPMVRPRTDWYAENCNAANETRVRTGPVPRPVRSPEKTRPPYRLGPETPRTAIRRSSASSGGLGRLQELYGLYQADDLQGAGRSSTLLRPLQIPEYHNTVDTILNWSHEILNWTAAVPTDPSKAPTT